MMLAQEKITSPKKLNHLLQDLTQLDASVNPDITGLSLDSRQVSSGDLFIAVPGDSVDGMRNRRAD